MTPCLQPHMEPSQEVVSLLLHALLRYCVAVCQLVATSPEAVSENCMHSFGKTNREARPWTPNAVSALLSGAAQATLMSPMG